MVRSTTGVGAPFTNPNDCDNLSFVRLASATAWFAPLILGACAPGADGPPSPTDVGFLDSGLFDGGPSVLDCDTPYPAYASTMALDQAVEPWSWNRALDGQNHAVDLNLAEAFCNNDPDIDWSSFDLLLFVSIPGW